MAMLHRPAWMAEPTEPPPPLLTQGGANQLCRDFLAVRGVGGDGHVLHRIALLHAWSCNAIHPAALSRPAPRPHHSHGAGWCADGVGNQPCNGGVIIVDQLTTIYDHSAMLPGKLAGMYCGLMISSQEWWRSFMR